MENEYYKEIPKNKGTASIVVIVILSILLVGALGYIGYDKLIKKDEPIKEETNNNKIEDVTNESYVAELNNKLITKDKTYGFYLSYKMDIENTADKYFVVINVKNYLDENNINVDNERQKKIDNGEFEYYCGVTPGVDMPTYDVDKKELNAYIAKKYNSKLSYDFEQNKTLFWGIGTYKISSDQDKFRIYCMASSGAQSYIEQKLIKAEKQGDSLYIYDKAVYCIGDVAGSNCYTSIDKDEQNYIYEDTYADTQRTTKEVAEYAINNLSDKLNTYKHTFKKAKDGNYYWVSSELAN